jgi:hypothetical protein
VLEMRARHVTFEARVKKGLSIFMTHEWYTNLTVMYTLNPLLADFWHWLITEKSPGQMGETTTTLWQDNLNIMDFGYDNWYHITVRRYTPSTNTWVMLMFLMLSRKCWSQRNPYWLKSFILSTKDASHWKKCCAIFITWWENVQ